MEENNIEEDLPDVVDPVPPVEDEEETEEVDNSKNSILTSIKKLLGITEECTDFDTDIIIHINTVLMVLNQLGIGKEQFQIEDKEAVWTDFIDNDKVPAIKTYTYLKVRLAFDPPTNAALLESIKESIKEYEWRMNVRIESVDEEV